MQRLKGRYRIFIALILSMVFSILVALPVLAGDGDGTGGGQGIPLDLASSTPVSGQQGVSTTAQINLTFNKNVINMTVIDNNKKCFSLYSADGKNIAINVIMADDQIHPELKRIVDLKPIQPLQAGTSYTVKISSQLQAKNGMVLGKEVDVKFTTVAAAGQKQSTTKSNQATETVVKNTSPKSQTDVSGSSVKQAGDTDSSVSAANASNTVEKGKETQDKVNKTVKENSKSAQSKSTENTVALAGLRPGLVALPIVILLIALGYAYYRYYYLKKRNR